MKFIKWPYRRKHSLEDHYRFSTNQVVQLRLKMKSEVDLKTLNGQFTRIAENSRQLCDENITKSIHVYFTLIFSSTYVI